MQSREQDPGTLPALQPEPWTGTTMFVLYAGFWLLLSWFVSTRFLAGAFWQALLALLLLSAPIALTAIYEASVEKTLKRERYLRQGWLFRLFSGRTLITLAILVIACVAGFFLLLRLHMLSTPEWLIVSAVIPVYWCLFVFFRRRLQSEYKPAYLTSAAMIWARLASPTLLVLLCLPLLWLLPVPDPSLALSEAIAREQVNVIDISSSTALATLAQFVAIFDGIKLFVLTNLESEDIRPFLLVLILQGWMTFYLVCTMLSLFLLPVNELRRIFGPLSGEEKLPPLAKATVAFNSALITFVVLFVFVPVMSYLEVWVIEHPEVSRSPARLSLRVEQIGTQYYAPGTLEDLQRARQRVLASLDLVASTLRQQTDAAFLAMEGNVDLYLDWYYSLGGEYSRIGNLLVGNLETYMAARLTNTLQQDDVFREVQATLDASVRTNAQAQQLYALVAETILNQSRVDPGTRDLVVVQQMQLSDFQLLPEHHDVIGFQNRMLMSTSGAAVAGVLTTVIAGKLTSKIIAKGGFKLAVKSLGKLAASKAAGTSLGAGTGAATGAAIGSVVPGFGTAIGAVIGGIVGGLAIGAGIDMALIEVEESIGRQEFKNELIVAIRDARLEFYETTLFPAERALTSPAATLHF